MERCLYNISILLCPSVGFVHLGELMAEIEQGDDFIYWILSL